MGWSGPSPTWSRASRRPRGAVGFGSLARCSPGSAPYTPPLGLRHLELAHPEAVAEGHPHADPRILSVSTEEGHPRRGDPDGTTLEDTSRTSSVARYRPAPGRRMQVMGSIRMGGPSGGRATSLRGTAGASTRGETLRGTDGSRRATPEPPPCTPSPTLYERTPSNGLLHGDARGPGSVGTRGPVSRDSCLTRSSGRAAHPEDGLHQRGRCLLRLCYYSLDLILSGLVYCGGCGRKMAGSHLRRGTRSDRLICPLDHVEHITSCRTGQKLHLDPVDPAEHPRGRQCPSSCSAVKEGGFMSATAKPFASG